MHNNIQLAAMVARMRLNRENGNAVNGAAPGFAVRGDGKGSKQSAEAARAYAAPSPSRPIPVYLKKLSYLDLPELVHHLGNAREIYSARSAVGRNANQMFGTMVDVRDDEDMTDAALDEDAGMLEVEEVEHEDEVHESDEEHDHDEEVSSEPISIADSELDASA